MLYIVFSCRKCGHQLYVDSYNIGWKRLGALSKKDCPECGEEGFENWILSGIENTFPGDEGED